MKKIKESIEKAKTNQPHYHPSGKYTFNDKQLLHLLSLVAEKQKDAIIYQLPFGVAEDRAKNTPLITEQLKEKPKQLPCDDTVCRLPHERVYRGCDECVYNKTK